MMAVLLSSLTDAELVSYVYNHPTDLSPLEWELAIRFRKSTERVEALEKEIVKLEDRIDELSSEVDDLEEELASR